MNDDCIRMPVSGGELEVTIDAPATPGRPAGRVVLVPPFGMSAERMFPAAYLLSANGFEVHRLDPRDHPGASTGTMATFHPSRLAEDVKTAVDASGGATVMAISLAARSVLRALPNTPKAEAAVLITPVVNVRATVREVTDCDWFERILVDDAPLTRVLGYDVGTVMIRDCARTGMVAVGDAIADVLDSRVPISFIAGDADPWVDIEEVRAVVAAAASEGQDVDLRTVSAASHQLYRNPVLAMTFLQTATERCLELAGRDPNTAIAIPFSEIVRAIEACEPARKAA
jgi:pimeloyl-ACP methyl ester carboxylesterase